jgi:hypothetical protein
MLEPEGGVLDGQRGKCHATSRFLDGQAQFLAASHDVHNYNEDAAETESCGTQKTLCIAKLTHS